jgi:hypothetical protein
LAYRQKTGGYCLLENSRHILAYRKKNKRLLAVGK